MTANGPTLGVLLGRFSRQSIGIMSRRGSMVAGIAGLALWIVLLALNTTTLELGIFELFLALAFAYALRAIVRRRHWPILAMFLWVSEQREKLYPNAGRDPSQDELAARIDALIAAGTGEPGTWAEIRKLAVDLQPSIRREHVLAMADLFETDRYEVTGVDAALAELPTDDERRYWRVRLATTEAFSAYAIDGDYVKILLDACADEGPFALSAVNWVRLRLGPFVVSAIYLILGLVVVAILRVAFG